MSMRAPEERWAAAMAGELRLAHASLAEATAEERLQVSLEEIREGLKDLPRENHRLYLQALAERFPTWMANEHGSAASTEPVAAIAPQSGPPAKPASPAELLNQFLATSSSWSAAERTEFQNKVKAALGIAVSAPQAAVSGQATKVSGPWLNSLGVEPGREVSVERLAEVCGEMTSFFHLFETSAIQLIKKMGTSSRINTPLQATAELIRQYLSSGPEVLGQKIEANIAQDKQVLIYSLIGIKDGITKAAHELWQKYHPSNLEQTVSSAFNKDAKCWDKFRKRYIEDYPSREVLEQEFFEKVVAQIEYELAQNHTTQ